MVNNIVKDYCVFQSSKLPLPLNTVSQQEHIHISLLTGWLYLSHSRNITPNWKIGIRIGMATAINVKKDTGV